MYSSVTELLNNPKNKRRLDGLTDITGKFLYDADKETFLAQRGQKPDPELLSQFMFFDKCAPVRLSDDFEVLQWMLKRNMSIASLIPVGGQVPSSQMGELIKIEGNLAKIALGHTYDERTQERLIQLSRANNIPKEFVEMLFGSVNDLQRKVVKLANVMCAQVFYQGYINFVDPRTQIGINVQYDMRPQLFPAPIDPAVSWDNYQTAQGIQNLIDHSYAYYQVNGVYPEMTQMSRELVNHLLRQESTATYAEAAGLISKNSSSTLPKRVTRKVLKQLIEDTDELPPIMEWDAQYEIEIAPGQTARARYIPSTHYVFCSRNVARRLFAPTIESAQANKGKPTPGIWLNTSEIQSVSPPQSRSIAVAKTIPVVEDPRRFGAAQVITS